MRQYQLVSESNHSLERRPGTNTHGRTKYIESRQANGWDVGIVVNILRPEPGGASETSKEHLSIGAFPARVISGEITWKTVGSGKILSGANLRVELGDAFVGAQP